MLRSLSFGFAALLGGCGGFQQCAPVTPAPESVQYQQPVPDEAGGYVAPAAPAAPQGDSCDGRISWDGRSPVRVIRSIAESAQHLLDQGNAVNIGESGYDHVAGHYSSHGSIFRAGTNLDRGDVIVYDCRSYTVSGRDSASAGDPLPWNPGLTVQYSGCGGVCLVFASNS